MMLCSLCQGINIHELVNEFKKPLEQFEGYTHQPSFAALLESSKTCDLCRLFRQAIGSSNNFDPKFDSIPEQIEIKNSPDYIRIQAIPVGKPYWDSVDGALSNLQICGIRVSVGQRLRGRGYLEVAAEKGSPASLSGNISGELIDSGAVSAAVFDHILSLIKTCQETHRQCSPLGNPRHNAGSNEDEIFSLPTRVLDIGMTESSPIRLFTTKGISARYAALSHRWGSPDTVECTTIETLEDRMKDIPFGTLSCLFQDAVTITRKIGIQYLWIDSLCIIQNSRQDWEQESAVMGKVYECAEVTISAVKSEDGASGFLGLDKQHVVPIPYQLSRNNDINGVIYFRLPVNRVFDHVQSSKLNRRGWVLQERVLSRRLLSFTKFQVYWECSEMVAGQGGPQPGGDLVSVPENGRRRIVLELNDLSKGLGRSSTKASVFFSWRKLVEEFSRMELTYDTDKLHAVLGLANRAREQVNSEYLCGIWTDDLPLSLFWTPWGRGGVSNFTSKLPSSPRAPSWSWASLEGPIRFMLDYEEDLDTKVRRVELDIAKSNQAWSLHLQVLIKACKVTQFGANWNGSECSASEFPGGPHYATEDGESRLIGSATFDLRPTRFGPYACLLLGYRKPNVSLYEENQITSPYPAAILLEATSQPDEYRRVGCMSLSRKDWFHDVKPSYITLI